MPVAIVAVGGLMGISNKFKGEMLRSGFFAELLITGVLQRDTASFAGRF
jgi:hypothetical protein